MPPLGLCVGGIFDLDPLGGSIVRARPMLGNDALQILLADHPEEIGSIPVDMIGIQERRAATLQD